MRKGDEKRQELLGAAERLFCQQGYEKTSVQDILNAVALSKGGFYHHFASKEEVLTALCARRAERAAAFTAEALNQASTPLGRINALRTDSCRCAGRKQTLWRCCCLPSGSRKAGAWP